MNHKNILITGCSSGIGLNAAQTLKKRGYQVFATARHQQDVDKLTQLGFDALQLDVTDDSSIAQALENILAQTGGRLEYLFNNGAYGQPGAIEDLPLEALREQFETNLFGWHQLIRKVLPVMRQQGFGRIVQNSSVLGFVAMPYRGAYNASKYALEGYTDTLRLELRDTPIKVILLQPGPIVSHFRANAATMFRRHIDWRESRHQNRYQDQLDRLDQTEAPSSFTLGPEAVTGCLIKALESRWPKSRYRITFPTHLFALLRKLLPVSWLDRILAKG